MNVLRGLLTVGIVVALGGCYESTLVADSGLCFGECGVNDSPDGDFDASVEADLEADIEVSVDDGGDEPIDVVAPPCAITDPRAELLNPTDDVDLATRGFQTDVIVETEAGSSILVELFVDELTVGVVGTTTGESVFSGVPLERGARVIHATCTDRAGNTGVSPTRVLTIEAPRMFIESPRDGESLSESMDALPEVEGYQIGVTVCTESPDAFPRNVSVRAGSGPPLPIHGVGPFDDSGCVELFASALSGCFEIVAESIDINGERAQASVSACLDDEGPRVVIVDPVGTIGACMGPREDLDPARAGIQLDVIACVSEPVTAELRVHGGSAIASSGHVVAAPCDTGAVVLDYTLELRNVTIPEGSPCLDVVATDEAGNVAISPSICVTVDTIPPNCSFFDPRCGDVISNLDLPLDLIRMLITDESTVTIEHADLGVFYSQTVPPSGAVTDFPGTTLPEGTNTMTCRATDRCGNTFEVFCDIEVVVIHMLEPLIPTLGTSGLGPHDLCVNSTTLPTIGTVDANFFIDGTLIGTVPFTGSPTCISGVMLTSGSHVLDVSAVVSGTSYSNSLSFVI